MQTDCPFSSQFLAIGDEGLKAFNMSVLGDTNEYQWKEFQGSVRVSLACLCFETTETFAEIVGLLLILTVANNDIGAYDWGSCCNDVAVCIDVVMV